MLPPNDTAMVIGVIPVGQLFEIDGESLRYEKTLTCSNIGSIRFRVDMARYVDFCSPASSTLTRPSRSASASTGTTRHSTQCRKARSRAASSCSIGRRDGARTTGARQATHLDAHPVDCVAQDELPDIRPCTRPC